VLPSTPTITQLATVISQATAPAFLLGALAAFIAILISRLNRIIDRGVSSEANVNDLKDKLRLKARAELISRAIMWAVASSIATALLLIVAFGIAFFNLPHEYGVGLLFVVALGAFTLSLINLAREVRLAVMDFEHFG
jgi:hypothetical protein